MRNRMSGGVRGRRQKPPPTRSVNEEVDNFKWFTFDEARANIKKNSLAERFLLHYLDHLEK